MASERRNANRRFQDINCGFVSRDHASFVVSGGLTARLGESSLGFLVIFKGLVTSVAILIVISPVVVIVVHVLGFWTLISKILFL